MTAGKVVTLDWYVDLPQARRAAERLKAAGIPSFLRGEAAALVASKSVAAGVRLEVAEADLEHAQFVLASPETEAKGAPRPEAAPVDPQSMTTVEVFYDPLEAKHAADLLRAHGIPCSVQGSYEGTLPGLIVSMPSMKLDVRACNFDRACEILGFRLEHEEGDDEAGSEGVTAGSDQIKAAESRSSRQIKRPSSHLQVDEEAAPAETSTPAAVDDLRPQAPLPSIEAGGGVDFGVVLFLLLLAGFALWAVIRLF